MPTQGAGLAAAAPMLGGAIAKECMLPRAKGAVDDGTGGAPMGVSQSGSDFPTIRHCCDPLLSTRTRKLEPRSHDAGVSRQQRLPQGGHLCCGTAVWVTKCGAAAHRSC